MTASAHPHLQLVPDRLDAAGVGDDADDRCLLDTVRGRLRQDRLPVLVAGEAKRGNTLLNVLLGRDVLPTGVVPVTALATTVSGGGAGNQRFPSVGILRATTESSGPAHLRLGRWRTRLTAWTAAPRVARSVPGR
jgi:hypothetical protein